MTDKLPAAIYARISRDRAGAGLGVERQETDCRELAKRLGWNVVAVYVDNDISAYSGKRRPQYSEMLAEVRAGKIRGILAWHTDRLHRRAVELESFVAVVEEHHVQVQTVSSGEIDLSTASGRLVARLLGATAQHEVDHARERMRRAKAQAAVDGRFRGGMRPYGFEADGVTIRASEAEVIREATTSILGGRTLAGVARELNERGEVTSTGRPWSYLGLRDVLVRPRNAGLLSRGRYERGTGEIIGPAKWSPIIDEETWRAVHTLLTDPSRRRQDGNTLRWFGSGLYRCGICEGPMRAVPYGGTPSRGGKRTFHYRCRWLNHLTINMGKTDDFVRGVVAEMVRDPRVVAAMQPQDDHLVVDRERRAVLVARLENFESDYAQGVITGSQLQKVTQAVTAELEQIDARLAVGVRQSVASPVLSARDPGEAFLNAPVDIQRAVAMSLIKVEVLPSARRGAAWSSDRVRLIPVADAAAAGTP